MLTVSSGMTTEITFEGITYKIEKVGLKYFVYQPSIKAKLVDVSGLSKNNCELLNKEIIKREDQYYICIEQPNSPTCSLLKKDALFRSKEENFQTPIIFYPTHRKWRIESGIQPSNEIAIKNHISSLIHASETDIIIKLNQDLDDAPIPFLVPSESSLLQRVMKILPLADGFLEPIKISNGNILVNNRYIACDLESGLLQVTLKTKLNLTYSNEIEENDLEKIWILYTDLKSLMEQADFQKLPSLIQAALIGRKIGIMIDGSTIGGNYNLEKILKDLFLLENWNLSLKSFSSQEDLKEKQYPVEVFSRNVDINWSLI